MIDMKAFQTMALSFPHTEQVPHFERIGFKDYWQANVCDLS